MDAATQSMIDNLPQNTGRSLMNWFTVLEATGLVKHTELMFHLKTEHGLNNGFANAIVLQFRARGVAQTDDALVEAQDVGCESSPAAAL